MLRYHGPKKQEFSLGCEDGACYGFDVVDAERDHGFGEVERAIQKWNKRP